MDQCPKTVYAHVRHKLDERDNAIIAAKKEGKTLEKIGDVLGITREWVRQIAKNIVAKHGEGIFEPDSPVYTAKEAAAILGASISVVNDVLAEGQIACRRRSDRKGSSFLITAETLAELKRHPVITRKRKCEVCGRMFTYGQQQSRRNTCSEKCRDNWRRHKSIRCCAQGPTPESLKGWHKELYDQLQGHRIGDGEKWVKLREAITLTGLSQMQIIWLGKRGLVATRNGDEIWQNGQPVVLYSTSQLMIARQVYEEAHQQKGRAA